MGGGEQIPSLDSAGVALYTYNLYFWELMIGHRECNARLSTPRTCPSGARAQHSSHLPLWRPCSTFLAPAPLAPVLAVARAAVLALGLLAPVLEVARAAVLALVLLAPVLAVARAAVLALVLLAPVLAVARAIFLALVRPS
jgi:hypothetical protein